VVKNKLNLQKLTKIKNEKPRRKQGQKLLETLLTKSPDYLLGI